MNYVRSEVTETAIDRAQRDDERLRGFPSQTLEQLLSAIAAVPVEPLLKPPRHKARVSSGRAPWQILRVLDHVELTLAGTVTVACLARIAKLSSSHFSRAFRASFGVTPAAYVGARRVERAKLMMLGTSELLCRISLDCGFTDQSHLSRAFRRQVGQSPRQWRHWHRLA